MWLPSRQRAVKPNRPPRVNRAHPLASGLVLAIVPRWGDIVSKMSAPVLAGNSSVIQSAYGSVAKQPSSATSDSIGWTPSTSSPVYGIGRDFSVVASCSVAVQDTGMRAFICIPWSDMQGGAASLMLGHNWGEAVLVYNNGPGAFSANNINGTGGTWVVGGDTARKVYGVSHYSNADVCFYKNGLSYCQTTDAAPQTPCFDGKQSVFVMGAGTGAGSPAWRTNGSLDVAFVFNRALSAADHASLARDPYQLLDYGTDPAAAFYANVAAAAGTINRRLRSLMGVGR